MAACTGSSLDAPLKMTQNNFQDICNWLKEDAYIVTYVTAEIAQARFFHRCSGEIQTDEQIEKFLDTHRIIYIDISAIPDWLDDGVLNAAIEEVGYPECYCALQDRTSWTDGIPHQVKISLDHSKLKKD